MILFAANERVESGRREEIDKGEEGRRVKRGKNRWIAFRPSGRPISLCALSNLLELSVVLEEIWACLVNLELVLCH